MTAMQVATCCAGTGCVRCSDRHAFEQWWAGRGEAVGGMGHEALVVVYCVLSSCTGHEYASALLLCCLA